MGDAKLARLINEYVEEPHFIHRSTIRNWSTGASKGVQNWRPGEEKFLTPWAGESEAASTAEAQPTTEQPVEVAARQPESHRDLVNTEPSPVGDGDNDVAPSAVSSATRGGAVSGTATRGRSRGVLIALSIVAGVVVVAGAANLLSRTNGSIETAESADSAPTSSTGNPPDGASTVAPSAAEGPTSTSDQNQSEDNQGAAAQREEEGDAAEEIPPVSEIAGPADGSVVGITQTFSGTASHPEGVAHLEMIIQQVELGVYWNPPAETWQVRSERFIVPVSSLGGGSYAWQFKPALPLPEGTYRARVWARASTGRGDPVGPLVEFTVDEGPTPDSTELELARAMQESPVGDSSMEEEETKTIPKVRVRLPEHGARVADRFRVKATAEHEPGLEQLEVVLRDVDRDQYWNFDTQTWQVSRSVLTVETPEDPADPGAFAADVWLPAGVAPPGRYEVTATAQGTDGVGTDLGRTNTFTVFGP